MKRTPLLFIAFGLTALILGALFGTLAAVQYIHPEFAKNFLAFNKMRPFHVSSVLGWIILTATGGIYYYLTATYRLKLFSRKLARLHFLLFFSCGAGIYYSFLSNNMGGREYMAYAPILSLPILFGWILFGINYFKTVLKQVSNWPVYLWMWGTGIVFMIYHFSEAHFWLIPHFRENFIRDISVQWKSYGSFVGSWNMLVYGTAIFLMTRIKGDESIARGKKAFFFYFLGLSNLMLGWAHHTYIIPTQPWVRHLAYAVSMTEWILLINIIISWKRSLSTEKIKYNHLTYKFLMASDFWVFVNLFVALLISIPFINLFTHGTHVTVAHSMGTTVGINTSILFASVFYIVKKEASAYILKYERTITVGFWLFNLSLGVFWICLLLGGLEKSVWTYFSDNKLSFSEIQAKIKPFMQVFLAAGICLFTGITLIALPLIGGISYRLNDS